MESDGYATLWLCLLWPSDPSRIGLLNREYPNLPSTQQESGELLHIQAKELSRGSSQTRSKARFRCLSLRHVEAV